MIESGYYPPGAEFDPNAPYNQPSDPDYIVVQADVSITLKKTVEVETNEQIETPLTDTDIDEDGRVYKYGGIDYDFSNVDIEGAYKAQHSTPIKLFEALAIRLKKEIVELQQKEIETFQEKDMRFIRQQINMRNQMIADCEGWEEDFFDYDNIEKA